MAHPNSDRGNRNVNERASAPVTTYLEACSALVHAARRLVGLTADRAVHGAHPPRLDALAELDQIGADLAVVEARLHRILTPTRP